MALFKKYVWPFKMVILEIVMIGIVLLYLMPLFMAFLYVFKDDKDEFMLDATQFPTKIYWGNFANAVKALDMAKGITTPFREITSNAFFNTITLTTGALAMTVLLSVMAAYAISRSQFKFYNIVYLLFVSGILVPYQAVFVPIYIIGSKLGFVNARYGVMFFYVATNLPFAVFMMTSFMKTLPREIEEAAIVDGCTIFRMLPTIIFPMMRPAVVTVSVMMSILMWNDYLLPVLFLQKPTMQTITVKLALLFRQYQWDLNVAFTGILLASIPVLIFFLLTQKHYIKGIAAGALKG